MRVFKLLILAIILPVGLYAEEPDSLKTSIDSLTETSPIEMNVDSLLQEINNLRELIDGYVVREKELTDTIHSLEHTVAQQKSSIGKLEKHLLFADTIVARLSNDCLRKKYDPARVSLAISNFEQMYSLELQSKFAPLKHLLNNYGNYTNEFVIIFQELLNDRGIGNPFNGKQKALSYISRIKETRYYREVYNASWTIPYLNDVIDKSIQAIKSFNPSETKELNLLSLVE